MWGEITDPFRLHRLSLEMDNLFHPTIYNGCDCLSMLGLKLVNGAHSCDIPPLCGCRVRVQKIVMMTSSNGNIFGVNGHICGEIHRSPVNSSTKTSDAELWYIFFDLRLNKRQGKQSWGWWFETPSRPLWRHCNVIHYSLLIALCTPTPLHTHPSQESHTKRLVKPAFEIRNAYLTTYS